MFPEPTDPAASRGEALLRYLDFFRGSVIDKVAALPDAELRSSRVPSGWTPLELVKHLTFAELRWIEWGFEGRRFEDPWGDRTNGRWHVAPEETRDDLVAALRDQGRRTSEVVAITPLEKTGEPGPRWKGAEPATLERVLLHLVQEYARHLGQLDIVVEQAGGPTGE
ncbi:DinB family protein [Saccharopolyspora sp. 5N102]|uniref:DinB family protein n=1 Tax=Saccharopolyspora sp. 5N102 TaxID=3375155 RepID=UPI0037B1D363